MAGEPASPFDALRHALKPRWTARLRQAPAAPPGAGLVTPEMLVLLVDGTIDRLVASLGGAPARRPVRPARFNPSRAGCHCGLHLLLTYYVAGAHALREALPAVPGSDRREVLRRFNRLAREEMIVLCGTCIHRGGSLCQLQPDPDQPPP